MIKSIFNNNPSKHYMGAFMPEIISSLTAREIEVIRMTAKGFKNCEIAKLLFISHKTVETHKNNILKKLKLKSTAELYCYIFNKLSI